MHLYRYGASEHVSVVRSSLLRLGVGSLPTPIAAKLRRKCCSQNHLLYSQFSDIILIYYHLSYILIAIQGWFRDGLMWSKSAGKFCSGKSYAHHECTAFLPEKEGKKNILALWMDWTGTGISWLSIAFIDHKVIENGFILWGTNPFQKRGVLATRSPCRPNPIGITVGMEKERDPSFMPVDNLGHWLYCS